MLSAPVKRARFALGCTRIARHNTRALRAAAESASTPDDAIDAALAHARGPAGLKPIQIRSEIRAFLSLVQSDSPQRVLEIGTADGGTLYLLAWASSGRAQILSLDIRSFESWRLRLYRGFARRGQHVEVFVKDSRLDDTRGAVQRFFGNEPLDLLFIDGDHQYEAIRDDFERYAALVRSGGLVALHDIVPGPPDRSAGVPQFWREVRSSLVDSREYVESWEQGGWGIGVGRRP